MKLIVFGATGSIGRHVVQQGLASGHTVTAFTRNAGKAAFDAHPAFSVAEGDVLDQSSVTRSLAGQEAVIVALGAGRKGNVRAAGTRAIIQGMKTQGTKRLVCQSTLGAGDSVGNLNFFWKRIMFGWFLKEAYIDHQWQEQHVKESGLDWIIVRPAAFTDGPATGQFKHGFSPDTKQLTLKISRADVARFLLSQVKNDTYLHQTPGLSY